MAQVKNAEIYMNTKGYARCWGTRHVPWRPYATRFFGGYLGKRKTKRQGLKTPEDKDGAGYDAAKIFTDFYKRMQESEREIVNV